MKLKETNVGRLQYASFDDYATLTLYDVNKNIFTDVFSPFQITNGTVHFYLEAVGTWE